MKQYEKQYKYMYKIPFLSFVAYVTKTQNKKVSIQEAQKLFNKGKRYFIQYILATSNLKNKYQTKFIIERNVENI